MGFKQIQGYLGIKVIFPAFSGFCRCCAGPLEMGNEGSKRADAKKGGQTPLTPPVATLPHGILSDIKILLTNFLRHVMRAIWSVRPKCSHRCVSLKKTPLKPVQSLEHTTKTSAEQTVMRTKWFKHIAI